MPTPLAPLTTLRLGGPALVLVECTSPEQLVDEALAGGFLLAGGSNVVLPDAGLDRVVLVRTRGIDGLTVQAGEDWDGFVAWSVAQGLSGLEALSGPRRSRTSGRTAQKWRRSWTRCRCWTCVPEPS